MEEHPNCDGVGEPPSQRPGQDLQDHSRDLFVQGRNVSEMGIVKATCLPSFMPEETTHWEAPVVDRQGAADLEKRLHGKDGAAARTGAHVG